MGCRNSTHNQAGEQPAVTVVNPEVIIGGKAYPVLCPSWDVPIRNLDFNHFCSFVKQNGFPELQGRKSLAAIAHCEPVPADLQHMVQATFAGASIRRAFHDKVRGSTRLASIICE